MVDGETVFQYNPSQHHTCHPGLEKEPLKHEIQIV
jgi:hypothetical protein